MRKTNSIITITIIILLSSLTVFSEDWPQYRYDSARNGASPETLASSLHLTWTRELLDPKPCFAQDVRLHFDYSYEPVVLGTKMFVPSMVTNSVTAYNTSNGALAWRFVTDGPVRVAPAAWDNKVYFVSDDGYLYCVSAVDGSLVWKFRGKPGTTPIREMLTNGRMTPVIPARGGPVIKDGIVYFGAGVWPEEGVFVHALNATTGAVVWSKTDISKIAAANWEHQWTDRPTGIAAQGHLAIVNNKVIVPCGSQLPGIFDVSNGNRDHYTAGWAGRGGLPKGTFFVTGFDKYLFCAGDMYDLTEDSYYAGVNLQNQYLYMGGLARLRIDPFNRETMGDFLKPIISDNTIYARHATDGLVAYDISNPTVTTRTAAAAPSYRTQDWPYYNNPILDQQEIIFPELWHLTGTPRQDASTTDMVDRDYYCSRYETLLTAKDNTLHIYAKAGNRLYCGLKNSIKVYDLPAVSGLPTLSWETTITGTPNTMLIADGKLFVVTKEGSILAFGGTFIPSPPLYSKPVPPTPGSDSWTTKATTILQKTGVTEGYVLMLGIGTGRLAEEFVTQSTCNVIAIESDDAKINAARTQFTDKGLYGTRISIFKGTPQTYLYLPYIADLIASENWSSYTIDDAFVKNIYRPARPYGGVICMEPSNLSVATNVANAANLTNAIVQQDGTFLKIIRHDALANTDDWSHKGGNAANTYTSKDKLSLSVLRLWTDSSMGWTRGSGASVQFAGGRAFIRGAIYRAKITAYDLYTGRIMWDKPNVTPNPIGEWVATPDALYFPVAGGGCVVMDAKTGLITRTIDLPASVTGDLLHIRVVGDKLFGSTNDYEVLCFDIPSGNLLWRHTRSTDANNMAIGTDKVYCASSTGTVGETLSMSNGSLLWSFDPGGKNLNLGGTASLFLAYNQKRDLLVTTKKILDGSNGSVKYTMQSTDEPQGITDDMLVCGITGDAMHIKAYKLDDLLVNNVTGTTFEARWTGCSPAVFSENIISTRDSNAMVFDLHNADRQDFYNTRNACSSGGYIANGMINNPNKQGGCACNYTPVSTGYVSTTAIYGETPPHYMHELTVTNGDGDGTYEEQSVINITADTPSATQHFVNWTTSNGGTFADVYSASTSFTMPTNDVTVTANFAEDAPVVFGPLSPAVPNITGVSPAPGSTQTSVTKLHIKFSAVYNNGIVGPGNMIKIFKSSDNSLVASFDAGTPKSEWVTDTMTLALFTPLDSNTQYYVTAPDEFVKVNNSANGMRPGEITAGVWSFTVGEAPPPTEYALTVTSGSGAGNYVSGAAVAITADAAPTGQHFDTWTTSNGGTFAAANSATTTFTMPANAVTVTANYAVDNIDTELTDDDIIVFMGDSITYQGSTNPNPYGYVGWITQINDAIQSKYPGKNITLIGSGSNGRESLACVSAFNTEVIQRNATVCVLFIGVNDVWHNAGTKEEYGANLENIIDQANAAGIRIIIAGPAVIGEKKDGANEFDIALDEFAAIARSVAIAKNVKLVDMRTLFVDYIDGHNPSNFDKHILTLDGVHPYPSGNSFIANAILDALIPQNGTDYQLSVANGVVEGNYASGAGVAITANTAPAGESFVNWTTSNGGTFINANSATTIFNMPANNVTITANYEDDGATEYALTVTSGSGTGSYTAGTVVNIVANPAPAGQHFVNWTGDVTNVASTTSATTTITMPASAAAITANYADNTGDTSILVQVANGNDDAEELISTGGMYLSSSDLELVTDDSEQAIGMRFANLGIPVGATITNAYIQFTVDEINNVDPCNLSISGELIADAPTFTTTANNISSRTKTSATVVWTPATWTTIGDAGADQRTSDISSVIQEIVNQGTWNNGNALVLMINGTGKRVAESYDGVVDAAPQLYVEYSSGGSTPHSADTNNDWSISQSEVTSFIGTYNNNNNSVSGGNGSFDNANRITMREVMRVIYLHNGNGAYKVDGGTVDGYDLDGAQGDPGSAPLLKPVENNTHTLVCANSADSGAGSFRNAIANSAHGDTITFDESVEKIILTSEILIDKSITIDGNGITIVSGEAKTRIFRVYNENEDLFVLLLNMGIVDGNNSTDKFGGAIYNNGENLTLENCLLSGNSNSTENGQGGAIYTSGNLTVTNCVFTDNSAEEENDIYTTNGEANTNQ